MGCDTFVVLPSHTKGHSVIFGKNSDRPNGEVQEVLYYPAKHSNGETLLETTYITIPEAKLTHAVILSKPAWMWGAEMGANDVGVVIGNEAVFTKLQSHEDADEKLLGMDLLRLGLERGNTAEHALHVITELLTKYGQGGPCSDTDADFTYHNSFLIADSNEAWVLETADRLWVAEKVTEGYRNISNSLSIGAKIDKMSENLKEECVKRKLWNGKVANIATGEFNFKKILSDNGDCDRYISGMKLLKKETASKSFTDSSMMAILRDKPSGINRTYNDAFPSAGSQVSVLSASPYHWFTATPDPSISFFKPFIFTGYNPLCTYTESPEFDPDPAKTTPRFQFKVDRAHELYKRHRDMVRTGKINERLPRLRELESSIVEEIKLKLQKYTEDKNFSLVNDTFNDAVREEWWPTVVNNLFNG